MIVKNEPYLIEYNVRGGRCQTILPKLKTNLIDILLSCCERKLNKINISSQTKKVCVLFCAPKVIPIVLKKI